MDSINLKAAIQKALSAIGNKGPTAPNGDQSNTYPIAHELFVASELRSAVNKRYDVAKARAAEAGVIDEDKTVEGAEIVAASYELFDVTMKRNAASTTLDRTQLKNVLMKRMNCTEALAQAIIDEASKPRKGAVTIGFTLKG